MKKDASGWICVHSQNWKLLLRDRSMSLPFIARGLKIARSRSPTDPVDTTDLVESESETRWVGLFLRMRLCTYIVGMASMGGGQKLKCGEQRWCESNWFILAQLIWTSVIYFYIPHSPILSPSPQHAWIAEDKNLNSENQTCRRIIQKKNDFLFPIRD